MTRLELAAFALNLVGLVLTAIGAFVAAKAVMIDPTRAALGSGVSWDGTDGLKRTLLVQSASARNGLLWVAVGTVAQINALCLTLAK
jgi:hypothetical protein